MLENCDMFGVGHKNNDIRFLEAPHGGRVRFEDSDS
jgi:hypothetical protein